MAIPKAKHKTQKGLSENSSESSPSTKMFAQANDKATRLQLYVRDRQLIKELKLASVEEEKSISQLFEEWATQWLEGRS
ncbi:peptide transporter [Corynebacterium striatum]|uniref:peptide transporter n=1 Tax=Corynebacterium striatum TaxID=43770 RepID=UPI0032206CBA